MKAVSTCFGSAVRVGMAIFLVVAVALGLSGMPMAAAASSAPPTAFAIQVIDATRAPFVSVPVFQWRIGQGPLLFDAILSRSSSSPVDVYFGIIIPAGRIFTWTPGQSGGPILREGLFPAAQGTTATQISAFSLLETAPQHTISAGYPLGLYSVFMLLVPTGANAGDLRSWTGAAMSPLLITN